MKEFRWGSTDSQIQILYDRLKLSTLKIIELVENDLAFKNIFNPKKHFILDSMDNDEFIKFQSLLENLNNLVYFNSLILVSFSTFEYSFKILCKTVNDLICPTIEFKEPYSGVINHCKDYLCNKTKVIDFSQDELDNIYCRIKNVNKLRNLITHHNGNLMKGNSKLLSDNQDYNIFKEDNRLSILGSGQVFIDDKDYILAFQSDTEIFLQILLIKLKNKT